MRFQNAAVQLSEAASYIEPEIMSIPEDVISQWLNWMSWLFFNCSYKGFCATESIRFSAPEEKLLAMQGEMAGAAENLPAVDRC